MRFRFGRKKPSAEVSKPADNPYVTARSNFEGLFRDQAKEKHAWKFASLAQLAIIGTLVVAYIQLASTSRVVPYVVEVDQLGQVAAFGPAEPLPKTDQRIWVRDLSALIRNLRSITTDPALQVRMIEDAYAFLDAAAAKSLNEYFADPENNPRVLGREMTRAVEINSVLPVPNSDSWQIRWTETERSRTGSLLQRRGWEAYLTVKQVVPETVKAIQLNPLGLYVTGINWTRIDTSDPEPRP